MKFVQFSDGSYGIMKSSFIFGNSYLSNYSNSWWKDDKDVYKFCRLFSLDDAKARLNEFNEPEGVPLWDKFTNNVEIIN